jgi:hypothetical protein
MDWQTWLQSDEFLYGWRAATEGLGEVFRRPANKRPFVKREGRTTWLQAQEPLPGVRLVAAFVPAGQGSVYLNLNVWLYDEPQFDALRLRFTTGPRFSWGGRAWKRTAGVTNRSYAASLPEGVHVFGVNFKELLDDKYAPGPQGMETIRQVAEEFCHYVRKVVNEETVSEPPPTVEEADPVWKAEDKALNEMLASAALSESEREAIVKTRIGQGLFRQQLVDRWKGCAVTNCRLQEALVASHIVPWSHCESSDERWSVDNGLLLIPALDKLFDRGFVSFSPNGKMLRKSQLTDPVCTQLGVNPHSRLRSDVPLPPDTLEFLARHRTLFGFQG